MTPTFTINQLVADPQTNKTGKVIALCNGPHPDRLHLPPKGTPLVQLLGDKPQPPAYWPNAQPLVWLQTYLGKQLRIPECNQDVITLEETAAVLSRICRFGARTWPLNNFYSVAEHSVRVADCIKLLGGTDQDQWEGINHEGDEAVLGFDPPSPLLQLCPDLKALKRKAHVAYQSKYGLPIELSKIVKHADLVLLATEKRDLMLAAPAPWLPMPDPLPQKIHPWQNPYARFINRWRELARSVCYNGPE